MTFPRLAVFTLIFSLLAGVGLAVQSSLVSSAASAMEATVPAIQSATSEGAMRAVAMVIGILALSICFQQALFPRRAPRPAPVKVEND